MNKVPKWLSAAGIILAAVFSSNVLALSCPAGQTPQWVVNPGTNFVACPPGTVIPGSEPTSQIIAACRQSHGTPSNTSGSQHWADENWLVAYSGTNAQLTARTHTSSHGVYGNSTNAAGLYGQCVQESTCPTTVYGATDANPHGVFIKFPDADGNLTSCANPLKDDNGNDAPDDLMCEINVSGIAFVGPAPGVEQGYTASNWRFSGTECTPNEPSQGTEQEVTVPEQTPQCETVQGEQVCTVPDNPNCITVNGENICSTGSGGICDPTDEGACIPGYEAQAGDPDKIDTQQGARITRPDATTPPKPNNGTPGEEAQEDARINSPATGIGGQPGRAVYNYYNPSTVAGSDEGGDCEVDPQGEGCEPDCEANPDAEGCEGECTDDPETPEDECGSGGGGGECPEGQECGFTNPAAGDGYTDLAEEILTKHQAFNAELETIRNELSAMKGNALTTGAAALPCSSFTLWGNEIPFCLTPYAEALSIIATVVLAAAAFLAAMIVLDIRGS